MVQEMQDFLLRMAIETKIDNYKEFQKDKKDIVKAICKSFEMSQEKAESIVEEMWGNKGSHGTGSSLEERRLQLVQEKKRIVEEYNAKIEIIEEAINGFSAECIAKNKGLSIEEVERILQE